jgi:hypothetical protein
MQDKLEKLREHKLIEPLILEYLVQEPVKVPAVSDNEVSPRHSKSKHEVIWQQI